MIHPAIAKILEKNKRAQAHPEFREGDTIKVHVKIKEGDKERLQAFEGVVIARRNRLIGSSFIVRKGSSGEGVERTFQLYSPLIASIEVKRRGDVRRRSCRDERLSRSIQLVETLCDRGRTGARLRPCRPDRGADTGWRHGCAAAGAPVPPARTRL